MAEGYVQLLRALVILLEDPGSVSSSHIHICRKNTPAHKIKQSFLKSLVSFSSDQYKKRCCKMFADPQILNKAFLTFVSVIIKDSLWFLPILFRLIFDTAIVRNPSLDSLNLHDKI